MKAPAHRRTAQLAPGGEAVRLQLGGVLLAVRLGPDPGVNSGGGGIEADVNTSVQEVSSFTVVACHAT